MSKAVSTSAQKFLWHRLNYGTIPYNIIRKERSSFSFCGCQPQQHIVPMTSRVLQWAQSSSHGRKAVPLVMAAAVLTSWCVVNSVTDLDDATAATDGTGKTLSFQIDVNFIDRLASKAYLQFSHEKSAKKIRPEGVPDTLRIISVDLPEVRQGFKHGHCQVDSSRVYPDGIASPEVLDVKTGRNKINAEVEQKAWIKSFVKCMTESKKVSVEIMEADMGRMNPSNIRRIHQYGTLSYDPGKYAVTSPRTDRREDRRKRKSEDEETKVVSEIQAPWYQLAWREEAMLRISGQVAFGETMKEADGWTKRFSGYRYKSTVASSSRSWLDTIFFWRSHSLDEGIDGSPIPNAASNRPHAVIVNGLALQLVPNSLKVLQKLCAEHKVPLFVIRDPRSWGGNTHPDDLGLVLKDVQAAVKRQIVTRTLHHAAGTAFARGRMLGRLESDATWQAKETVRKSKEFSNRALDAFRKQQETDWSSLSEEELEKRLAYHGLLRTLSDHDGEKTRKEITEALSKIVNRCDDAQSSTTDSTEEPQTPATI
eukprot:scaffold132_cov170-Amphora_coffeaeformis.AAC.36